MKFTFAFACTELPESRTHFLHRAIQTCAAPAAENGAFSSHDTRCITIKHRSTKISKSPSFYLIKPAAGNCHSNSINHRKVIKKSEKIGCPEVTLSVFVGFEQQMRKMAQNKQNLLFDEMTRQFEDRWRQRAYHTQNHLVITKTGKQGVLCLFRTLSAPNVEIRTLGNWETESDFSQAMCNSLRSLSYPPDNTHL